MMPLAAHAATTVRPNVTCNWPSYMQLLTPDGNLLTPPNNGRSVSDPFFWNLDFQGVALPGSFAVIKFVNTATGQEVDMPSNDSVNGNCVLNMEPNVFPGTRLGIGTWTVSALFEPWEIGFYINEPMGTLTLD
jgi:hypothetical protein